MLYGFLDIPEITNTTSRSSTTPKVLKAKGKLSSSRVESNFPEMYDNIIMLQFCLKPADNFVTVTCSNVTLEYPISKERRRNLSIQRLSGEEADRLCLAWFLSPSGIESFFSNLIIVTLRNRKEGEENNYSHLSLPECLRGEIREPKLNCSVWS